MRNVGLANRAVELWINRVKQRGYATNDVVRQSIASCVMQVHAARLLCWRAAAELDRVGAKDARFDIASAFVFSREMVMKVVWSAIKG